MPWLYTAAKGLGQFTFRAFGRLEVRGRENVPGRGSIIIVSNHLSNSDPPVVAVAMPREISFVAKRGLFGNPFTRWLFRSLNAYPVDRDRRDVGALKWAIEHLRHGGVVLMFPEGTRSRTGGLSKAQIGVAYLAVKSQATIVPVGVTGTERVQGLWRVPFPLTKITVTFGEPFTLPNVEGELPRAVLETLTDTIMRRIAELLPPAYQGVYTPQTTPRERKST